MQVIFTQNYLFRLFPFACQLTRFVRPSTLAASCAIGFDDPIFPDSDLDCETGHSAPPMLLPVNENGLRALERSNAQHAARSFLLQSIHARAGRHQSRSATTGGVCSSQRRWLDLETQNGDDCDGCPRRQEGDLGNSRPRLVEEKSVVAVKSVVRRAKCGVTGDCQDCCMRQTVNGRLCDKQSIEGCAADSQLKAVARLFVGSRRETAGSQQNGIHSQRACSSCPMHWNS